MTKLREIAHSRTGDKGNTSNISVIAYDEKHYPLLLEQVHLPAERFPGLLATDLEHGSLYDLLTERYGVRVAKAREFMEPVLLRAREARLLGRKPGSPALLIEGIAGYASVAITNARNFASERSVARTLQETLLSELPKLDDPVVAVRAGVTASATTP